jgi:Hemerythrin HHE cation binding domain
MADAAVRTPIDVVRFVRQHEQIKPLIAETLAASGNARERAWVELWRLLAADETAEEEIVHPRAKRKIPYGDKIIGPRLDEEHNAKTVLAELEKLDVGAQSFTDMLTKLRDAVVEHAEQEEKQEFHQARAGFGGRRAPAPRPRRHHWQGLT